MQGYKREKWIDAVKGLTIIMVVFHHVFSGVDSAIGFDDFTVSVYNLLVPIRMPLFFLVAGLFAKKSLDSCLTEFVDSKVLHFLYFYVVWSTVNVFTRAAFSDYANNAVNYFDLIYIFWEPVFSPWFLYALFFAFVTSRFIKHLNVYFQIFLALALAIYISDTAEGKVVLFRAIKLFPFFLVGLHFSSVIRFLVSSKYNFLFLACSFLYLSCSLVVFNTGLQPSDWYVYYSMAPIGILLVMSTVFLISKYMKPVFFVLNYTGQRSLYVYVMHFVPAAACRPLLTKIGFTDPLIITFIGTLLAFPLCLLAYEITKNVSILKFLYKRPDVFTLSKSKKSVSSA
ncbi:acyltransferase family protein [Alkalimonas mucilaginosa]|uniref:Acyltransferase family protein n=1 Tax=Alkalimonas mucilaginosa TaxID=3057676 RepID=A0ABU7JFM0_9GAMM|nr:acyltransferase family protein [Alkalimonas sp. MEB004]MEE2024474.1 acyltransferase family protein [Alkalimonas sp. MEB004]